VKKRIDVFISYRRKGGIGIARSVNERLTQYGYNCFFDIDSLRSGEFNEKIFKYIDMCKDFIVILTPNSLDETPDHESWMHKEIRYALEHNKNIIPIADEDFTYPEIMPPDIEKLKYINTIKANEELFNEVIERVKKFLRSKSKNFIIYIALCFVLPIMCILLINLVGDNTLSEANLYSTEALTGENYYLTESKNSLYKKYIDIIAIHDENGDLHLRNRSLDSQNYGGVLNGTGADILSDKETVYIGEREYGYLHGYCVFKTYDDTYGEVYYLGGMEGDSRNGYYTIISTTDQTVNYARCENELIKEFSPNPDDIFPEEINVSESNNKKIIRMKYRGNFPVDMEVNLEEKTMSIYSDIYIRCQTESNTFDFGTVTYDEKYKTLSAEVIETISP
jgi:hypothetical protein